MNSFLRLYQKSPFGYSLMPMSLAYNEACPQYTFFMTHSIRCYSLFFLPLINLQLMARVVVHSSLQFRSERTGVKSNQPRTEKEEHALTIFLPFLRTWKKEGNYLTPLTEIPHCILPPLYSLDIHEFLKEGGAKTFVEILTKLTLSVTLISVARCDCSSLFGHIYSCLFSPFDSLFREDPLFICT